MYNFNPFSHCIASKQHFGNGNDNFFMIVWKSTDTEWKVEKLSINFTNITLKVYYTAYSWWKFWNLLCMFATSGHMALLRSFGNACGPGKRYIQTQLIE